MSHRPQPSTNDTTCLPAERDAAASDAALETTEPSTAHEPGLFSAVGATCAGCGRLAKHGASKNGRAPSLLDLSDAEKLTDGEAAHVCMHECGSKCCRHVAWGVDTPTSKTEYEEMRWAVIHPGLSFFKEDGDWFMLIRTDCSFLRPDGGCGNYENRPEVCRDYKLGECEHPDGLEWDAYIDSEETLDAYIAEHHPRWRMGKQAKKKTKTKKKAKAKLPKMSAALGGVHRPGSYNDVPKSARKPKLNGT